MDFYKFCQILNERSFPERPDTPPDHPEWEDKDLQWSDWDEDGVAVKLVDGRFVDSKNSPVPFLDQYATQAQNWDQTHGISLQFHKMIGTLPGFEDPRTGEHPDDEQVAVRLEKLALADFKNQQNKIELPDNLIYKVKAHFFPGYD
jgi:hypothetical protein